MTKITVFGQEGKKAIEFVRCLTIDGAKEPTYTPEHYGEVMLMGKNSGYDLIIAYDEGDAGKAIYLGHWNDGVVG